MKVLHAAASILIAAVLATFSSAALAQVIPLQGGGWFSGHMPMYSQNGGPQPIFVDGGPASGGAVGVNPSELGITARGSGTPPYIAQGSGPFGANICDYDAPTSNAAGYHYLCLSANSQGGGLIAYGAGGPANPLPLYVEINGVKTLLPGGGGGGTVTSIATGTGLTGGPITTTGTISIAPTITAAGPIGDATHVAQITYNAQGQLTAVTSVPITGGGGGLTVGTTTITGGANGSIEFNNAGVLGEKTTTGSGSVALATSPTIVTPTIAKLANLTTNGLVATSAGDGTLSVTVPGTGVLTALGVNTGSAGAFVVNGGALGTPSSGVATNLTGTAAGLTAGNVTTNANLTGVITSVGNATSIASQTGTGTKFVVDTSPTLKTSILVSGLSTGTATIVPQSAAGTPTLTLPTGTGTFAVSASAPIVLSATTGALTCPTCATSSGGGAVTGTAPVAVSAAGVVSITGAAGQVLAGASPAFTATPMLGVAGATLGTLTLAGSTSGSTVLQPNVAASGTLTLPAATDTLIGKATTDTLTNKTYDTAGAGNSFSINGLAATANTGTGSVVRATSPALTTPDLGTPSAIVATNATGTASSLTAGITNALASATTTVNVSAATAPTTGQSLIATDSTHATWQTPAGGGTVTHTGNLTSNAVVLGNGSADTKVVAGVFTDGTSILTLGQAGTSVGGLALANATSGTVTLSAPTGALGAVTVTVPDATDTLVNLAGSQTLSNKTFVAPALGTPASGVGTNLTGTAASLTSGITQALKSATTTVDVSAATAPSANQVLTATDSTHATWQTPSAGGVTAHNTSDQTVTSSSALVNATGLSLAVSANTYYQFQFVVKFTADSTGTAGVKIAVTCPSSPTLIAYNVQITPSSTAAITKSFYASAGSASIATLGGNENVIAVITGVLDNAANAGSLVVQFAQNSNVAAATTLKAGSSGVLTVLP